MRRVGLCLRVRPHAIVHGRNNEHGTLCRKQAGREQIIRLAGRGAGHKVGRRGCDDNGGGGARQSDVVECVPRIEEAGVHRPAGERLERNGADEFRGGAREHDVHLRPRLDEQASQPRALVACDTTGHAKQHATSSIGPKSGVGHDRRMRKPGVIAPGLHGIIRPTGGAG